MSFILDAFTPAILEVTGTVASVAITAACGFAMRKWGIEVEAKHREALHSALMTGARAAIGQGILGKEAAVYGIEYAKKSVPDALRKTSPTGQVLADLAMSKVEMAMKEGAR